MHVTIVLGSSSDARVMKGAAEALDVCGVEWEARILSAHRMPEELKAYVEGQVQGGSGVFIAGAGLAAHLPGVIASHTVKPVIGVPIRAAFDGLDALLSIVQMPKGVPVATVGVNNSYNAGLLAVQMLAAGQSEGQPEGTGELEEKLQRLRRERAAALLKEPQNREVFE
ncbi:MAG: 5-(carboxyamino)imidazole ribonucleotide mutase [Spirochaetia bacterium]|nr:5-(carboxyamino)imidazole ribonucleotide mutase [Spirochaetia bacterium]